MSTTEKTAVLRLVEKVERAGQVRLGGGMRAEDWRELATLAAECREMLVADSDDKREWREALEGWKQPPRLCGWCDSDATETRDDGDGFTSRACDVHAAEYFAPDPIAWGFVTAQGELREVAA